MTVGDIHSQARGSGARFNDGKVRLDLIPLSALEDCARVFDYGRQKYAAWNWAKGMDWTVPYGCALRHLSAWFNGEDNDPESGLSHLGHVMCNLVILSTFARTFPEGDNRPVEWLNMPAAKALDMVSMEPTLQASQLAHADGHTADGGGLLMEGVSREMLRDGVVAPPIPDPEQDDDEGPKIPGYPPTCKTGGCDD